jgi:hypothetical protein
VAICYKFRSFGIFLPLWYVWTKKDLATMRTGKKAAKQTLSKKKFLKSHKKVVSSFLLEKFKLSFQQ